MKTSSISFMSLAIAGLLPGGTQARAQLWSDTFAEAENYSLVIRNDAVFDGNAKVYEAFFVGGNLTASNGEFGSRLPGGSLGLYVDGAYNAGGSKMLSNGGAPTTYHVNSLSGSFVQGSGTTGLSDPVTRSTADIFSDFETRSAAFFDAGLSQANLDLYGAVYAGPLTGDSNNGSISVSSGKLNILNIDGASSLTSFLEGNGNLSFVGFTAGTRLVINYEGAGAADQFLVSAKIQGLAESLQGAVLFNLSNFGAGAYFAPGGAFHASVLAPTVDVTWAGNDLDGAIVANSLNVPGSMQFHDSITSLALNPLVPVPEPSTYGLAAITSLVGIVWLKRRRTKVAPMLAPASRTA